MYPNSQEPEELLSAHARLFQDGEDRSSRNVPAVWDDDKSRTRWRLPHKCEMTAFASRWGFYETSLPQRLDNAARRQRWQPGHATAISTGLV